MTMHEFYQLNKRVTDKAAARFPEKSTEREVLRWVFAVLKSAVMGGNGPCVSRLDLVSLAKASDRSVRKAVENLAASGIPIISYGEGYFIATESEQISRAINYNKSYIRSLVAKMNGLELAKSLLAE